MHVIHTIYNSIHLHDMQDIRNLPISYITFYTISFRSNFVKKKGGDPYNFTGKARRLLSFTHDKYFARKEIPHLSW